MNPLIGKWHDYKLEMTVTPPLSGPCYKRAEKEGYPNKYQVLCANHNLKKQIERLRAQRIQSY